MNTLIIIGIIVIAFIGWNLYPDKNKKIYQDYAQKNNWEYSRTDNDYLVYETLKTSLFYKIVDSKTKVIRKPYSVFNILRRDTEIVCTASMNSRASALLPNYLIYHNNVELPKLFILSKKIFLTSNKGINYYKDEFDEINTELSSDKYIVIVNSYNKELFLPKIKKIMPYFSEEYYLMIRNNNLVIYTFNKKIQFSDFIIDCQKIKNDLSN
jgi:hypothetical protein